MSIPGFVKFKDWFFEKARELEANATDGPDWIDFNDSELLGRANNIDELLPPRPQ